MPNRLAIVANYRGWDVFFENGAYYALRQGAGPVHLATPGVDYLSGPSQAAVERLIKRQSGEAFAETVPTVQCESAGGGSPEKPDVSAAGPTLAFCDGTIEGYLRQAAHAQLGSGRPWLVVGDGEPAAALAAALGDLAAAMSLACEIQRAHGDAAQAVAAIAGSDPEAVFAVGNAAAAVLTELSRCAAPGFGGLRLLCAPKSRPGTQDGCVFVNGIPKSGTHLLLDLLSLFGFEVRHGGPPYRDGGAYFLNGMTQHATTAVRAGSRSESPVAPQLGNVPVLFMMRDPRDIAVSWCHYLCSDLYPVHRDFLNSFPTFEERLLRVIRGDVPIPFQLGPHEQVATGIRDLVLAFADWLELARLTWCIPLRFEDLVGPAGGGSLHTQLALIWRLQLALRVPGRPVHYAAQLGRKRPPTFRRGIIGAFRDEFTSRHHAAFAALPQDFMDRFGYGRSGVAAWTAPGEGTAPGEPAAPASADEPEQIESDYFGFNLVQFREKYYALAQSVGPFDLAHADPAMLEELARRSLCWTDGTLAGVKLQLTECALGLALSRLRAA
jgi:hypothetical protein